MSGSTPWTSQNVIPPMASSASPKLLFVFFDNITSSLFMSSWCTGSRIVPDSERSYRNNNKINNNNNNTLEENREQGVHLLLGLSVKYEL